MNTDQPNYGSQQQPQHINLTSLLNLFGEHSNNSALSPTAAAVSQQVAEVNRRRRWLSSVPAVSSAAATNQIARLTYRAAATTPPIIEEADKTPLRGSRPGSAVAVDVYGGGGNRQVSGNCAGQPMPYPGQMAGATNSVGAVSPALIGLTNVTDSSASLHKLALRWHQQQPSYEAISSSDPRVDYSGQLEAAFRALVESQYRLASRQPQAGNNYYDAGRQHHNWFDWLKVYHGDDTVTNRTASSARTGESVKTAHSIDTIISSSSPPTAPFNDDFDHHRQHERRRQSADCPVLLDNINDEPLSDDMFIRLDGDRAASEGRRSSEPAPVVDQSKELGDGDRDGSDKDQVSKAPAAAAAPPSCNGSRVRTAYTSMQIITLERQFMQHMYLTRVRRIQLAHKLNLSEKQIKIWFQNRRVKHKKETQPAPKLG